MSRVVSQEQLIELTGYKKPYFQRRKLASWGITPFVNARGENIVMWSALDMAQCPIPKPTIVRKGPLPNTNAVF